MTDKNNKPYILGVGLLVGFALLKRYFGGRSCTVSRNMNGQIAVVTGGNTGIGKETVRHLAHKGCIVIIGARDNAKSQATVQELRKECKNGQIHHFPLDLSSKASIRMFAQHIIAEYARVDILVNNAAILDLSEKQLNADGLEMHFAVNYLGHFYLTSLLWGVLKHSDRLRIINVSALAHKLNIQRNFSMFLDFDHLDGTYPAPGSKFGQYDGWYAYSASKLALVMFTLELAKKVQKVNREARVVSLHPGIVRTEIGRNLLTGWKHILKIISYPLQWFFMKSAVQGAQTTIHCAFETTNRLQNGGYYADCRLDNTADFAKDEDNQKQLWERSERMLGITFPVE